MRHRIDTYTVALPPALTDLTDESFLNYLMWMDDVSRLQSTTLEPFTAAAKKLSAFDTANRPPETTSEVVFDRGNRQVTVKTTPINSFEKSTTYSGLCQFIDGLIASTKSGEIRDGITVSEVEPSVDVALLRQRYELLKDTLVKSELRQEVDVQSPATLEESLDITYRGRQHNTVNEMTTDAFHRAKQLIHQGNERVVKLVTGSGKDKVVTKRFKEILKDDLTRAFDRPEHKVYTSYGIAAPLFAVGFKPQSRAEYSEILEDLFKPIPAVIKTNSRIGIFSIIEAMEKPDVFTKLQSKQLVPGDVLTLRAGVGASGRASTSLLVTREYLDMVKSRRTKRYEEVTVQGDWHALAKYLRQQ
jgi:hypothetical protein